MGVGLCEFESHRPHKETSSSEDVFLHFKPGRSYYDESYNFQGKRHYTGKAFHRYRWRPMGSSGQAHRPSASGKRRVPVQRPSAVGRRSGEDQRASAVDTLIGQATSVKKIREIHLEPESPF